MNEEEELKKGCGKEFYTHDRIILVKCGTECKHDKRKSNQIHLCPTCQARLEGFQKGKLEERERIRQLLGFFQSNMKVINEDEAQIRIDDWEDLKEQLQKEIGEEKQDGTK